MSRVHLMVYSMLPPLLETQRHSYDDITVTFETFDLFLSQLLAEYDFNRSQLLLTEPPLLPCATHLPIHAKFRPELFGFPSRVSSGN